MSKALQRINQQVVEITPSPDTSLINAGQVVGTRANSDDQMIALWLETKRNPGTRQQYANAIRQFLDVIGHPQRILLDVTTTTRRRGNSAASQKGHNENAHITQQLEMQLSTMR